MPTKTQRLITYYPAVIVYSEDSTSRSVSEEEAREGVLAVIAHENHENLREILYSEGFKETELEIRKENQIGEGLVKELIHTWEMHVRLFRVDGDHTRTRIEAEIKILREYVQHLDRELRTAAIYEVLHILWRHGINYHIFDRRNGKLVAEIPENYEIVLNPPATLIPWEPIVVTGLVVGSIAILLHTISKLRKEPHETEARQ